MPIRSSASRKRRRARGSATCSRRTASPSNGAYDIPTAFVAQRRLRKRPSHIAICAEYDALPGIGHACGHNIIAAAAAGAGIAAARIADDVGLTVRVIGTPAEEGGGGKILLLERGAFDGVHASMMVHPAPADVAEPPVIAVSHFDVYYTGKAAHASSYPDQGINAADALTVAQVAIRLAAPAHPPHRSHPRHRHQGWRRAEHRARQDEREILRARAHARPARRHPHEGRQVLRSRRVATARRSRSSKSSSTTRRCAHDSEIADVYRHNAEELGRVFADFGAANQLRWAGSTDMGNISLAMPAIHPMIGISSLPAVNHQPEFTEHCATPIADLAIYDGALAMAWTAIDLAGSRKLRERLLEHPYARA